MVKLKIVVAAALCALCIVGGAGSAAAETISEPGVGMSTQTVLVNARTFSKLKVAVALRACGVWPQVKAYLEANDLWDLFLLAQDFREDNPLFISGKAVLQAQLGWTDAQVEAVLSQCVKETHVRQGFIRPAPQPDGRKLATDRSVG